MIKHRERKKTIYKTVQICFRVHSFCKKKTCKMNGARLSLYSDLPENTFVGTFSMFCFVFFSSGLVLTEASAVFNNPFFLPGTVSFRF